MKVYELTTIEDIFNLPIDCIELCMDELKEVLMGTKVLQDTAKLLGDGTCAISFPIIILISLKRCGVVCPSCVGGCLSRKLLRSALN